MKFTGLLLSSIVLLSSTALASSPKPGGRCVVREGTGRCMPKGACNGISDSSRSCGHNESCCVMVACKPTSPHYLQGTCVPNKGGHCDDSKVDSRSCSKDTKCCARKAPSPSPSQCHSKSGQRGDCVLPHACKGKTVDTSSNSRCGPGRSCCVKK